MDPLFTILILTAIGGAFMAFNNGSNDVANSFASAVGAGAISTKQAMLIAGMMNLLGAVLIGGVVSSKIIGGVVDPTEFSGTLDYSIAMLSILPAAGGFVLVSTALRMPVSSSHSVVGALIGVTLAAAGPKAVHWGILSAVVGSWFVSPFLAMGVAWVLNRYVQRRVLGGEDGQRLERVRRGLPILLGIALAVFVLVLMKGSALKAFKPKNAWDLFLFVAVLVPYGTLVARGIIGGITRRMEDTQASVDGLFRRLQVGTSSYVSFAHGANDVANAISPVIAVFFVWHAGALPTKQLIAEHGIPLWILLLGGLGIAAGIGLLGHRVIDTLGQRITKIDNAKGFCIDFSAATTVVAASLMGLPVSSTHAATGAIVGVGVGEKGMNYKLLGQIVAAWLITVPIAGALAVGCYHALSWLLDPPVA